MTTSEPPVIEGFVELLKAAKIAGWVWEHAVDAPLTVELLVDGAVVGQVAAVRLLQDLLESGKGNGKHSFEFEFAAPIARFATPGLVQARVYGRNWLLPQTDALVEALRATLAGAAEAPSAGSVRATPPPLEPEAEPSPAVAIPAAGPAPGPSVPAQSGLAVEPGTTIVLVGTHAGPSPRPRATLLANLCRRAYGMAPAMVETASGDARSDLATLIPSTDLTVLAAAASGYTPAAACRAVIVTSVSLPNMLVGALLRHAHGCALLVDIDADVPPGGGSAPSPPGAADAPDSEAWTKFARALIGEADGVITASAGLRHRHGGLVVRGGRDERHYDPAACDRAAVRAQFGYGPDDRVLVFIGDPQPQDGLAEVGDALERLADARLALCVFGRIADPAQLEHLTSYRNVRLSLHPAQPGSRRPELIAMADCVPVLQTEFRAGPNLAPALLVDALAMDVPVLAVPAASYADLAALGAVQVVADAAALDAALRALAASPAPQGQAGLRDVFLGEFSHGVNAARLVLAVDAASHPRPRALPGTAAMLELLQDRTGIAMPRIGPNGRRRATPLDRLMPARDLVIISNDHGLGGETARAEMLGRLLLQGGKVERVFLFNQPISGAALNALASGADGPDAHRDSLAYAGIMRRVLGTADTRSFLRRTFLYRGGAEPEQAFGRALPPLQDYPRFVEATLAESAPAGDRAARSTILWVFPPVAGFEALKRSVQPALTVAQLSANTPPGNGAGQTADDAKALLNEADLVFGEPGPRAADLAALRDDLIVLPETADPEATVRTMWNWIEQPG